MSDDRVGSFVVHDGLCPMSGVVWKFAASLYSWRPETHIDSSSCTPYSVPDLSILPRPLKSGCLLANANLGNRALAKRISIEAGVEHPQITQHFWSPSPRVTLTSSIGRSLYACPELSLVGHVLLSVDSGNSRTAIHIVRNYVCIPSSFKPSAPEIPNDSGPAVWQCMHDWSPSGAR